jgi:hypothetical protein|tara:strand:- start:3302 stop:3514 length:213 start_codon:yes stop_codon:yes gene_type:complete
MEKQTIKFRIRQDGTVEEQVEGCTGPACEILTKDINEKLGELQYIEHSSAYYQSQEDVENVTLHANQDQV